MSTHDLKFRIQPEREYGIPRKALTDIYRIKHGMPLDGESHERFIATKVPKRKNKDYRPRFRNFSFGYPVIPIIKIRLIKKMVILDIGIILSISFKIEMLLY